eukprot:5424050-Pleurochrysis_carterae.AAC.1
MLLATVALADLDTQGNRCIKYDKRIVERGLPVAVPAARRPWAWHQPSALYISYRRRSNLQKFCQALQTTEPYTRWAPDRTWHKILSDLRLAAVRCVLTICMHFPRALTNGTATTRGPKP